MSGLYWVATTVAIYSLALSLALPVLASLDLPLNSPDSCCLGISPKKAEACLAVLKCLVLNKLSP